MHVCGYMHALSSSCNSRVGQVGDLQQPAGGIGSSGVQYTGIDDHIAPLLRL